AGKAVKVMTGSTNFSVTGLYVNSNHILVFDNPAVAAKYAEVFDSALQGQGKAPGVLHSKLSSQTFLFNSQGIPPPHTTFSPHTDAYALQILNGVVNRVNQEGKKTKSLGNVLFAVMEIGKGTGPVYPALQKLHANQSIFSYGISDTTSGISLYRPGAKQGV